MAGIPTIHYAVPPLAYFWQWSDDGTAHEWADNQTLAFQEEILAILKSLAELGGIPPLGTLLLVHAACSDHIDQTLQRIDHFIQSHPEQLKGDATQKLSAAISSALLTISKLPAERRQGTRAKAELCHAIFSRNTWARQDEGARTIVEELESTPPSKWAKENSPQNLAQRFLRDSSTLIKAIAGFETHDLEQLIITGIEFPNLSEAQFQQDLTKESVDSRSLLDKLSDAGGETRALSNIAKQVIGLISLPLPVTKEAELPIGGVADIVNRGTPDRLLVSELAWGDTILATRLAQNEALYYHRETPPENSASERIILMDHGLRYWGLPRLFALATHLGLKCHTSTTDKLTVTSYISTQEGYTELSLEKTSDIKVALSQLPTHLSFTPALGLLTENILELDPNATVRDVFLISLERALSDPESENALHQLTSAVRQRGGRLFLTLIDNDGHLVVYEYRSRGKRKHQEGQLNLDELLPKKAPEQQNSKPTKKASTTLIRKDLEKITGTKFYNQYPPPLWFIAKPTPGSQIHPNGETTECIGLDTLGHLMRWSEFPDRAFEISEKLPGRTHRYGQTDEGQYLVACSGQRAGESARVFLIEESGHAKLLPIEKTQHSYPRNAVFQGDYVIFIYQNLAEAFSIQSGRRIATRKSDSLPLHEQTVRVVDGEIAISAVKPLQSKTHQFFSDKASLIDESLGEIIIPTYIGFTEFSALILISADQSYIYSHEHLTWEVLKNPKKHRILKTTQFTPSSEMRFANEGYITTATLSLSKVTFSHDPRGILHISTNSESWSLHTHVGKGSLWKSRNPNEPRAASKEDFLTFFHNIRQKVIPKTTT